MFHVTSDGLPEACIASLATCSAGGDAEHFFSLPAAAAYASSISSVAAPSQTVVELIERINKLADNPARRLYGFPEDELTRSRLDAALAEEWAKLKALTPFAGYLYHKHSLTVEDVEVGVMNEAQRLAATDALFSWSTVMGTKRRTAAARGLYLKLIANTVRNRPALMVSAVEGAAAHRDKELFARCYEDKCAIPAQYEEAFEQLWEDSHGGGATFERRLKALLQDEKAFASGALKPKQLVNTHGFPFLKTVSEAQAYFKEEIPYFKRVLATRGRSDGKTVELIRLRAKINAWAV